MALKPWYKVITPREDLREGRPLDASEFAVHLDHVRDGRAPDDYKNPERFFERTFLTSSLIELGAGAVRRLSGIKVETSAVYNLTTQFGGGKTHALTLLYHIARAGPAALSWKGVQTLLDKAGVKTVPGAATAVFVGTEFDSLTGRGGKDGTPLRRTPWGDIAFQLGGEAGFAVVAKHEEERTAPSTEVIRQFLPKDGPALILMDELLNYLNRERNRKTGLGGQLYSFLQNLSEEARAQDRVVLAVSLPSVVDEMTPEDEADFQRFEKLLDRLGKAMIMSAESETSEIIRRRLFEWGGLPDDAKATAAEYAEWVQSHRAQVPNWFAIDRAKEEFSATYPFHPTLLSVFERKWQALPRFQQTRGVLRLLALWVANAYQAGFKGAHKDPLIGMGTAPLDDPLFRSAVFEQLGGAKLEGAVTTDICGKKDSHAVRLDKEAVDTIRKARLHRKVATAIFFESNGGQAKAEATLPEIRLAVAEPDLDVGNVETALEALSTTCYFLSAEKNRYRFSLSPNLNKLLADRRASVQASRVEERIRAEVQKVFAEGKALDRIYFPDKSAQIPDGPRLTLVVLPPEQAAMERSTRLFIESATKEHGASGRTFKSALVWAVPDAPDGLRDDSRKVLAWEDIADEDEELRLDDGQKRQLAESLKKAHRDIKETVWRTYKNVMLLGADGQWKTVDLGLVHSSAAPSIAQLILERLGQAGDIEEKGVSPNFLVRNWPPAFKEWSTRSVRDAFFASPQFPRLLVPDSIKDTIARGVETGMLGYVGKRADGSYSPFHWSSSLLFEDVEISDDVFLIQRDVAEAYAAGTRGSPSLPAGGTASGWSTVPNGPGGAGVSSVSDHKVPRPASIARLVWTGDVPHQKWMNFYTKVLSKFAASVGLKITLRVEVAPAEGVSPQKVEETKVALRELGLKDSLEGE
ncbi:MAG: ATP-binding protein [Gemmatimonadales bacterium]